MIPLLMTEPAMVVIGPTEPLTTMAAKPLALPVMCTPVALTMLPLPGVPALPRFESKTLMALEPVLVIVPALVIKPPTVALPRSMPTFVSRIRPLAALMIEPVTVERTFELPSTKMSTALVIVPEFVIEPMSTAPEFEFDPPVAPSPILMPAFGAMIDPLLRILPVRVVPDLSTLIPVLVPGMAGG